MTLAAPCAVPVRGMAAMATRGPQTPVVSSDHLFSWLALVDLKMRDIVNVTAYEKRLQHAAFLCIDLVRAIESIIASQRFYRRRRRQHAIGLTRRLEPRGDVDGIAPHVVGELTRADDPCHHRTGMQAHPDRKRGRQPSPQPPGGSNHVESEFRRHPSVRERGVGTPETAM